MSKTQSQPQKQRRIKPSSIVYWLRFFFAVAAGAATVLLHVGKLPQEFRLVAGMAVGLAFYAMTVGIVKLILRYGEAELKGRNRHITLGGGTFIVVWIMVSVLLYTLGWG